MMAVGGQTGKRESGTASRLTAGARIFAALLLLQAALPLPDRTIFRHIDRLVNAGGTLAADARVDQPPVQPRSPVPAAVSKARILPVQHALAIDPDSPGSVAGAATPLLPKLIGVSLGPAARNHRTSVPPRAFDARAPPGLS